MKINAEIVKQGGAPVGGDAIIEMGDTMVQGNGLLQKIATNTAPRPARARPPGTD